MKNKAFLKCIVALVVALVFAMATPAGADEDQGLDAPPQGFSENFEECRDDVTADEDASFLIKVLSFPSFISEWTFCPIFSGLKTVGEGAAYKVSEFWDSAVGEFTEAVLEGNAQMLQTMMTFWMSESSGEHTDATMRGVKNIVSGLSFAALVASLLIGGLKIASSRRAGLQDGVEDSGAVVVKYLVFALAIPAMMPGALMASDILANEIMGEFGVTDAKTLVEFGNLGDTPAGPVIMLVLALISMAGAAVQLLALVIRILVLPIAAGLTPIFAALSFTDAGRGGLNHLVVYLTAGILFKPVSAVFYSVVMWNVTRPGEHDFMTTVLNVLMIAVAGFMAPALVRMIVPVVSQAGGGSAGAALGMGMATGAAIGGVGISAVQGGVKGAASTVQSVSQQVGASGGSSAGSGAKISSPGRDGGGSSPAGAGAGGRSGGGSAGAGAAPGGADTSAGGGGGGVHSSVGAASPSGAASVSGGSPAASAGAGGAAAAVSQAATPGGADPSDAEGSGGSVGGRVKDAARFGASVASGVLRVGAGGVGGAIAGAGRALPAAERRLSGIGQRTEALFAQSLGSEGSYHGQVHR